jgi:hypothetical protein
MLDTHDASIKRPSLSFRGGSGQYELWDAGYAEIVPTGRRIAMDFGTLATGSLCWKPFDDTRLQPLVSGVWPTFPEDGDYIGGLSMNWLVEGAGLVIFRTTSRGALAALERIHRAFSAAPEAADGLLPAFRLAPSTGYAPRRNPTGTAFVPAFSSLGWMLRDSRIFGRRLVPPPHLLPGRDEPRRIATDRLFDEMGRVGEVLPPDAEPYR